MVTERDSDLLLDCYQNAALSVSQIQQRHFPGLSKPTALNRLTRLRKNGFIKCHRVGIFFSHGVPKKVGCVYQITKAGLEFLKHRCKISSDRSHPISI